VEAGVAAPASLPLDETTTVTLGRSRDCSLVLGDRFASKRHAELVRTSGRWTLRDLNSTNGTRINNRRMTSEPATLADGDVIGIGEVRLRFIAARPVDTGKDTDVVQPPLVVPGVEAAAPAVSATGNGRSPVPGAGPDTLASLVAFLTDMQRLATPQELVGRALAAVCRQTRATMAGYLSLDEENPLPKMVYPPQASVDTQLSKQLTQQVLHQRRRAWLSAEPGGLDSESLADYRDALCIPLVPADRPDGGPLGALHVYKTGGTFSDREARFCEVLAGFLAGQLLSLRTRRALEADKDRLRVQAAGADNQLVGNSRVLQALQQQIARVADSPATVLIIGESGVGKELVAASLHGQSQRREGPFVAVNCPALAMTLLESELFGHKKGAFTGATEDKAGCFARADEGTLFLDEIGEMSPEAQVRLLRVLQNRTFTPVGGVQEEKADVRVIAATNRDLQAAVKKGTFRNDLYFRLATITITVPPLREHAEDIPQLVEYFLDHLAVVYRRRPTLTEEARQRLQAYTWPGNVRQLRAVLETAVANCEGDGPIDAGDLRLLEGPALTGDGPASLRLKDVEKWAIIKALQLHKGRRASAANELGIHRETLGTKMREYGIEWGKGPDNGEPA
jgi:Nif-specific regulatory protein